MKTFTKPILTKQPNPKRFPGQSGESKNELYVDPGLDGTGYAFYLYTGRLKLWGVFRTGDGEIPERIKRGIDAFHKILAMVRPDIVYFEDNRMWSGSAISVAAAGRGDLSKLSMLTGAFIGEAFAFGTQVAPLLSPQSWKGSMPDDVVAIRLSRIIPDIKFKQHEREAVAMYWGRKGLL